MARAFILIVGGLLLLGSCTERAICPAYQSAYIHDRHELQKKFSYFKEDSTPKILTASKNRYLVAEPTPYRKKLRNLQTVEMKPVPVQVPDSLVSGDSVSLEELDRAARSVIDSTFIPDLPAQPEASAEDSVYVITKDKELRLLKYDAADSLIFDPVTERYVAQRPRYYVKDVRLNIDQDAYMWYLRDYLVLPDVRLARLAQQGDRAVAAKTAKKKAKKEKQGLKGFFQNLFKKKPKDSDSIQIQPPPQQEEFDFIDVDTVARATPPVANPEPRKGVFSPRRKKNGAEEADDAPVMPSDPGRKTTPDDARKEEEGF